MLLAAALYRYGRFQLRHMTGRQTSAFIILSGISIVVLFTKPLVDATYYGFFLLETTVMTLLFVWLTAVLLWTTIAFSCAISSKQQREELENFSSRDRWILILLSLMMTIGCIGLDMLYLQTLTDDVIALYVGPNNQSGLLRSIEFRRSYTYAAIGTSTYQVPDENWLRTLAVGKVVVFISDPRHTAAFSPDMVAIPLVSSIFIGISVLLWFCTFLFIIWELDQKQVAD